MSSPVPPPPYKVVLLGDSSVGKTSLVTRFTTSRFNQHTANTIGAAFITKEHSVDDRKVHFEIWDTAGQERYRSLTPMYYRNARVALVCFDMDNVEESLNTAKYWIDQLAVNGGTDSSVPIRIKLVGNKRDLLQTHEDTRRQEEQEAIEGFCSENDLEQLWETSAKDGHGVNELFDGIVKDIEEDFFTEYYQRAEDARGRSDSLGQLGFILNRREANNNCC
ncbi:ras-domain-containing protein [Suhomyces tanzawaensis NRRL Y-17324]|uniref:Ras-domain-containing protein n=1 Tax=Suhomyces tanzawaensis NRRL Y-17324 TaxID=984487 RepID=A0A1E4SBN3_9ASCO|nr:ras-domain-containing protein [Suhomyces tanzawaensis NRRL Y-17324]ODV76950.1 ras-domain-containing protein [Suhomyces tanzawaensis NRRL Y-17324]